MRILSFKLFENERPVISYDFDGCLHTSVIGYDPINFTEPATWEPFTEMHDQLRKDAKDHKIVIVTARPPITNEYVWEFIKMHNLPVEEVYATDNMPKLPVLKEIGAIKHYDDHKNLGNLLTGSGIDFVLVDPKTRTMSEAFRVRGFFNIPPVNEDNGLKNYLITFINEKFYISDNTIKAFITQLRKLDADLIHDPKNNGKGKNSRGIMVRSSTLTQPDIKALFPEFIKKYDWLKMDVVSTKYS